MACAGGAGATTAASPARSTMEIARKRAIRIPSGYHGHRSRPTCCGTAAKIGRARRSGAGGVDGRGLAADGQDEPEGRASIGPVERPDAAPVCFDDGATDREPQPCPTSLRSRTSIELFEDAILLT